MAMASAGVGSKAASLSKALLAWTAAASPIHSESGAASGSAVIGFSASVGMGSTRSVSSKGASSAGAFTPPSSAMIRRIEARISSMLGSASVSSGMPGT